MPIKLFEDFRGGEIDLKEVLKNKATLKSDLGELKIDGKKSADQINTIKNVFNLFDLKQKIIGRGGRKCCFIKP